MEYKSILNPNINNTKTSASLCIGTNPNSMRKNQKQKVAEQANINFLSTGEKQSQSCNLKK